MKQLITNINWTINNYCKADCFYCPSRFKNGPEPRHISEYKSIAEKLINHYKSIGRTINWSFSGGELLDMFDFPEFLKLCKTSNGTIKIETNGGKLWLDWWAIEPYVDNIVLSYHYWQNPNLIKFIIQTFQKANKSIFVIVPLRPRDEFDTDWNKAIELENEFSISVQKLPLNKLDTFGYLEYTEDQFRIMFGDDWVEENIKNKPKSVAEKFQEVLISNPSFTGKLCNVGIEHINIQADGWATGSNCNTLHLGNIWDENFILPSGPTACKMISCIHPSDQQITKFD